LRVTDTDQIRAVRDYYLNDNGGEPSLYHIWEQGAGRGDVTTPATSSQPYRRWLGGLLRGLLAGVPDPGLLSLGCGNGMIEAEIAAEGVRVLGVDALEDAVELARAKGVDAVRADVLSWTPPPGPWTVVYADGILGHLYDPETGVSDVLRRFGSWLPAGGTLVVSNDPPRTDAEVQENPKVSRYFWFSRPWLHRTVEECGFGQVTSTAFTYQKPLSGPRERIVVTGRR
jgi:SAM-dependent methyltransferase